MNLSNFNLSELQKQLNSTAELEKQFQEFISPADLQKIDSLRRQATPKESAVMVLIYPKNTELHLALIQRKIYKGAHSGQISLPGGKREQADKNLQKTAIRECKEEIGVTVHSSEVIASTSPIYIPPSNFDVYPFYAFKKTEPTFEKDEREVQEIIELPLSQIKIENLEDKKINHDGRSPYKLTAKGYQYKDHFIWGATARILAKLHLSIATKEELQAIADTIGN